MIGVLLLRTRLQTLGEEMKSSHACRLWLGPIAHPHRTWGCESRPQTTGIDMAEKHSRPTSTRVSCDASRHCATCKVADVNSKPGEGSRDGRVGGCRSGGLTCQLRWFETEVVLHHIGLIVGGIETRTRDRPRGTRNLSMNLSPHDGSMEAEPPVPRAQDFRGPYP